MNPIQAKNIRRVAMWSGPRNISTAMMRAWSSRADTIVCDEPLYAHYLQHTGYTHHPGYDEIIAAHETQWQPVVASLTGALPAGKHVFYQKHMAHHLLPHISLAWTDTLTNAFLIRDPKEMILSLLKVLPDISVDETGLPQQLALFWRVREHTGRIPPVIDAKDVLCNPREMLTLLCERIGITYDSYMLRWKPGLHATDGVWARHWYRNTANSIEFAQYAPRTESLPAKYLSLWRECQEFYNSLAKHRIVPANLAV